MAGIVIGQDRQVFINNIKDLNGNIVDPVTLTLEVRKPGGTVTVYTFGVGNTIVKDSVGNYHANLPCDTIATWEYTWTSTQPDYADGGTFYVNPKPTSSPILGQ